MVEQVAVLANELNLAAKGVAAVVALLADKNTVPFIARYRKEATGGLDEVQIRAIEERRAYLSELEDRRAAIAVSIEEQGKRTPELRAHIDACSTKAELEDLYLPYKRQRRTRGVIARERGLEPLADRILAQPTSSNPATEAAAFVGPPKYVADVDAALAGARDIVAEIVAKNATVRAAASQIFAERGELVSKAVPKNTKQPTKFEQYYDFREPDQVRQEVLVDLKSAVEWITFDVDAREEIPVDRQGALTDELARLIAERSPIHIDGSRARVASMIGEFVALGANEALARGTPVPEPLSTAIVGVTLVYETASIAESVSLDWGLFSAAGSAVPLTVTDPLAVEASELTQARHATSGATASGISSFPRS